MSRIQKRMLVQILAGFLIGRIDLWGLNPVGIAYFAAGFVQGGSVLPVGIAIVLGMITKLQAADYATKRGVEVHVINGSNPENLYEIFDGNNIGTMFLARQ